MHNPALWSADMGFPRMANRIDYAEPSEDHRKMQPYWDKVSVMIGGQDEVISAGEMLLPKFPGETADAYSFRRSVAKYTNIIRDIFESLASKPFEEEIQLVNENGEIADFAENVDGDGNNLSKFAADVFFNGIANAIDWIFVDYPVALGVRTVADLKASGVRPYWSRILAANMLEAKVQFLNGKHVLTYARFLENPKMGQREVKIFERGENGVVSWQLFVETDKDWLLKDEGVLSIDTIPLVPFITGRREGRTFKFYPALTDAVNLQGVLFRQESGLEYAKTMTAFPMLCGSGVSPPKDAAGQPKALHVGPQAVLYAPVSGDGTVGSWSYIEPGAQSLEFLAKDIDATKRDLRELGKQPLTAQSANLTVITTAYAAGKSRSAVKAWGNILKDALENALKITAKYLNLKDVEPEVSVYDEYDDFSEDDVSHIEAARKNGDLSQETYWAELKRRNVLSAEFDAKAERKRLLNEVPGETNPDDDDEENPAKGLDDPGETGRMPGRKTE